MLKINKYYYLIFFTLIFVFSTENSVISLQAFQNPLTNKTYKSFEEALKDAYILDKLIIKNRQILR
jgi:hypothetical protein